MLKNSYTLYIAKTGEHVDGYAILDEENGQHLPISFAVKLSPSGAVEAAGVMVYRERYGDEVRDPRFRQQFVQARRRPTRCARRGGHRSLGSDDLVARHGAGRGRALVLFDELVLRPARDAAAAH